MSLPWVRLDANIYSNDKILELAATRGGKEAAAVYMFSLAYAGGHLTDGLIRKSVLPVIHGTPRIAQMLVDHGMWEYDDGSRGWWIKNFLERQELAVVAAAKRKAHQLGAAKTNCTKHHDPGCECWKGMLDED